MSDFNLSYTSDCYLGPVLGFMFRTLVVAHGEINGQRYIFADYFDEDVCPAGTVPDEFKERAEFAFKNTPVPT